MRSSDTTADATIRPDSSRAGASALLGRTLVPRLQDRGTHGCRRSGGHGGLLALNVMAGGYATLELERRYAWHYRLQSELRRMLYAGSLFDDKGNPHRAAFMTLKRLIKLLLQQFR